MINERENYSGTLVDVFNIILYSTVPSAQNDVSWTFTHRNNNFTVIEIWNDVSVA